MNKLISGYELSMIFASQELTESQANELCEKVMDLVESSYSVNVKLTPIVEGEE